MNRGEIGQFLKQLLKSLWYDETSLCQLCGQEGGPVCASCTRQYFQPELDRCGCCGKLILRQHGLCQDCLAGKGPQYLTQVFAWGHYAGEWKEFILSVKFQAQPHRMGAIAGALGDWASQRLPLVDVLIPVPMHSARLADRGFNQAEVIASLLHWELGIALLQGLERSKSTTSQVALSRRERLTNLEGAFRLVGSGLEGLKVCLVDDVTTTGATLDACAKELRAGGVQEVYAFCLAAGMETGMEKGLVQPLD